MYRHDAPADASLASEIETRIRELDEEMPRLYHRHPSVFALANVWAERYDAIMAMVPQAQRLEIETRLARIGIRWGLMPGARVTMEFRASDVAALAQARQRTRNGKV